MCYDYEKMSVHSCKQYILVYDHTITDTHCTGVERTEIRIKRNGGRGRCRLHGNVGTCIIDSRIKRVTFYIPAFQKAFAKRVQKSMYSYTCLS